MNSRGPFQPESPCGPVKVLPLAINKFLHKAGMIENQLGISEMDNKLLWSPVLNGNLSVSSGVSNGVLELSRIYL